MPFLPDFAEVERLIKSRGCCGERFLKCGADRVGREVAETTKGATISYLKSAFFFNFISDRVKYFERILDRTKCTFISKEQKNYLLEVYKMTLHPFYFKELQNELIEDKKQLIRVELVLVDK